MRGARWMVLVAAVIVACGSVAPTKPTKAEACIHYVNEYYAREERCGTADPDHTFAKEDIAEVCARIMKAPGTSPDGAEVEACANTLAAYPGCGNAPCFAPGGTLRGGAPCGTAFQCLSEYCESSQPTMGDWCGVCVDAIPNGESCVNLPPFVRCAPGLTCDGKVCRPSPPALPLGSACGTGAGSCVLGTLCIPGPLSNGPRTCAPFPTLGQPCDLECAGKLGCVEDTCVERGELGNPCVGNNGPDCAAGLFCDTTNTKTCIGPTLLTPGEACSDSNSRAKCAPGSYCDLVCVPFGTKERGASCVKNVECAPPNVCVDGSCVLMDPGRCK